MNDRDIEDTRQPPDYPEFDEDEAWERVWDELSKPSGEFLQSQLDELNNDIRRYRDLYFNNQRSLRRIVNLYELGSPIPEVVIAIAEGKL